MKTFSKDNYNLPIDSKPEEIVATLRSCTFVKRTLSFEKTDKVFIGIVGNESFDVIDAAFPIGLFCVIKGKFKPGFIQITTSLQPTFRRLFMAWFVLMLAFISFSAYRKFTWSSCMGQLALLIFGACFFRLILHVVYTVSRDAALSTFKKVLGYSTDLQSLKTEE